jgi:hypothetical protein
MTGARFARAIMIIVTVVIVLGLVLGTVAAPLAD